MGDQAHVCPAEDQTHQGPDVGACKGTGPSLPVRCVVQSELQ